MATWLQKPVDNLKRSDFVRFGERHDVRKAVVESMLDWLSEGVTNHIPKLEEAGLSDKTIKHLAAVIAKRCKDLRRAKG